MRPKYYKIPIDTSQLFRRAQNKPKLYASLKQSLDEHIQLLLMTAYQELRYNHGYGTIISSLDYSTETQSGLFERSVEKSVYNSILKFEPRLKDLNVRVRYDRGGEILKSKDSVSFKVYIIIQVQAIIEQLDEKYENTFKIFFSPLTET